MFKKIKIRYHNTYLNAHEDIISKNFIIKNDETILLCQTVPPMIVQTDRLFIQRKGLFPSI